MRHRRALGPLCRALVTLLLAMAVPSLASAQLRGPVPEARGWAPVAIGLHLGYDNRSNGELLGAHVRIPILRSGRVELAPGGNVTFAPRLKEYQGNLDLVYVHGPGEGPYLGGGVGLRNTIYGDDPADPRDTRRSYALVLGVKAGGRGPIATQIEFRWIFLPDRDPDPQVISIGANFPLWGRSRRPGA